MSQFPIGGLRGHTQNYHGKIDFSDVRRLPTSDPADMYLFCSELMSISPNARHMSADVYLL